MNEEILNDPNIKTFVESIQGLKEIDDETFSDEAMPLILAQIDAQFSEEVVNHAINEIIENLERANTTRVQAIDYVNALKDFTNTIVYGDTLFTGNKRVIIDKTIEHLYQIFDTIKDKYHFYNFEMPIMLEEGAQIPTYAHESDAAADMYAMEDVEVPARFKSVPVKTGVHIQLPENWVAILLPRSSIGAKTPLRLSNSAGVIDSGYRGEIRALYDNISDESYSIHKGDRIAQLMVMPSYRFKAVQVESLEDSDRGQDGFGSTGA